MATKDTPSDPDLEDENEEEETDDEEQEEPEPAGVAAPPPPPPAAAAAPAPPKPPKPRKPRPPAGVAAPPLPLDPQSPAHPGRGKFSSSYAEEIIEEVFDRLRQYPELGTIYDIDVECWSRDGQAPLRVVGKWPLVRFQGDQVRTPGTILRDTVIDEAHMIVSKGQPVTYDLVFMFRSPRRQMTRGLMPLGSVDEINSLRRAQWQKQGQAGMGGTPQQGGYGYPYAPQQANPPVPAYVPPQPAPYGGGYGGPGPAGYGSAPPYDPQTEQLRGELRMAHDRLARTEGQLQEVMAAFREGRAVREVAAPAAGPAAGLGAPAPQTIREVVQAEVASAVGSGFAELKALLGFKTGPTGIAAPPPSAGARLGDTILASAEKLVTGLVSESLNQMGKQVQTHIKAGIGLGNAAPDEPEEILEVPDDGLPYVVRPTGAQWADGRPVMDVRDKTTGERDWSSVVMSNPTVMEAGGAVMVGAVATIKDVLSKIQMPDGSQVVSRTPRGAVDATPRPGMGAVPPPPAPPPAPKAAPTANGAAAPSQPSAGGFATH